jgi:hypothetical protein
MNARIIPSSMNTFFLRELYMRYIYTTLSTLHTFFFWVEIKPTSSDQSTIGPCFPAACFSIYNLNFEQKWQAMFCWWRKKETQITLYTWKSAFEPSQRPVAELFSIPMIVLVIRKNLAMQCNHQYYSIRNFVSYTMLK